MIVRAVDLFAGGGGLSLGFQNAGIDVVAAFDHWAPAVELYQKNIKDHPIYQADLSDSSHIEKIRSFSPDLIMGGPPCQDFSSAGKRDESRGRANLTVVYSEIIRAIRPRMFVMENVERSRKSVAFQNAKKIFQDAGYAMSAMVLDASLCGVPQKRKRFFVYGELEGVDNQLIPYIMGKQSNRPMTVRDYFGDRLGFDHYYRHPRSYKRRGIFSVDEPSPTIRGVNRPLPDGYPGHSGDTTPISTSVRALTTKERSLIQTFPDTYILSGTKTNLEQIIGNAVPVKLAEFVAECILNMHEDRGREDYKYPEIAESDQLTLFEQRATYSSV